MWGPLPYPTAPAQDVYFSFLTTPAWPVWDVCGEENYDNGLDPIEGDGEVKKKKVEFKETQFKNLFFFCFSRKKNKKFFFLKPKKE